MWTEVTTRAGHRAWVAWDAEQADEGALVVLEHDPGWGRPWAATVLGPDTRDGISDTPHEALRLSGCGLTPPDVGAEVTDDRGRVWRRPLEMRQCWTSRGAGDVHDAGLGGAVWAAARA